MFFKRYSIYHMKGVNGMKRWITIAMIFAMLFSLATVVSAQPTHGATEIFIDDCDRATGWSAKGGNLYRDWLETSEGIASIMVTADLKAKESKTITVTDSFEAIDMRFVDEVTFDLYISDLELLDAAFMFTASLRSEVGKGLGTWNYSLRERSYVEGWNSVTLKMTDLATGTVDLSRVDGFILQLSRIVAQEDMRCNIRIDNIRAVIYERTTMQLATCDGGEVWFGPLFELDTQDKQQGEACMSFTVPLIDNVNPPNNQIVTYMPFSATNVAWADSIEMDVYLNHLSFLPNSQYGIQFELTSSGRCDHNEMCWTLDGYMLKEGWNHIRLPFSAARINGGDVNLEAVNYIRYHIIKVQPLANELVMKIDNIFYSAPVFPESVDPEQPHDPDPPANPDEGETGGSADALARQKLTATRAKIVLLIFAFAIIGTDITVVVLRRRQGASTTEEDDA